ncbi:MAG: ATP-binding cassette domain-containing protein [Actinomycetia bacterium]|nr:ATP-binding cassette domain-containing protein [Actinomycetes bacterium]
MKVTIKDVSYTVDGRSLVDSISLEIPTGTTTAVIGPNGAGKSTLLHLIAGDIVPSRGAIWYDSDPLTTISLEQRAKLRSVLDASREPNISFTVEQVVAMGRFPHRFDPQTRGDTDAETVNEAINDLDLGSLRTRPVRSLSGGEQQRVAIARVLAQRSPIVLLDEPTTALDIGHQATVMAQIKGLRARSHTVVAVLHDVNMATAFDNVVLIQGGTVLASGAPPEVLTSIDLTLAYGHRIDVVEHPAHDGLLILPRTTLPPSHA